MAPKRKVKEEQDENTVVIENEGPIIRIVVPLYAGEVVELTGSNGTGKSEVIKSIRALASGDLSGLSLRDGAEGGCIKGFGAEIKLNAKVNRKTGEFDLLFLEEGFTLASFVSPGSKAADPKERAKSNDKNRLKDLASILGVKVEKEEVYRLLGGMGEERQYLENTRAVLTDEECVAQLEQIKKKERSYALELISDKTTRLTDPAEYIASLKDDCDRVALDREKEALVIAGEADGLESTLPPVVEGAETDEEVLAQRVATARNFKTALEQRDQSAVQAKNLAEAATELLKAGQGQTVEDATRLHKEALSEVDDSLKMIEDLEEMLTKEKERLLGLQRRLSDAAESMKQAESRQEKLAQAKADLEAKLTRPTNEEWAEAEADIKLASDAMLLGADLRRAADTRQQILDKRTEIEQIKAEAVELRDAAKAGASLLVNPINQIGCGIEVDEQMRIVCVNHPIRERCYFEELSDGERWTIAIQLMTRISIGVELPAVVPLPQIAYESLDPIARAALKAAVAKTKLMVVVARATAKEVRIDDKLTYEKEGVTATIL